MTILIWFGFFLSLALLLIIARKNLWLGLFIAAYVLGLFSLSFKDLWRQTYITITDPSILLLALAVGLIPMIGGAMEYGHLMDDLVNNIRMKRSYFMAFTSAFVGMLPMPGGMTPGPTESPLPLAAAAWPRFPLTLRRRSTCWG